MKRRHKINTPFNIFDPKQKRIIYNLSAKGGTISGEDDTITQRKYNKRHKTQLVPATWTMVFLAAFLNALLINIVRSIWIKTYGAPQFFSHNPNLDPQLTPKLDFYSPPANNTLKEAIKKMH